MVRAPHPPHHPRKRVTHPGALPPGRRVLVTSRWGHVWAVRRSTRNLRSSLPQGDETIEARELIKAAVIRGSYFRTSPKRGIGILPMRVTTASCRVLQESIGGTPMPRPKGVPSPPILLKNSCPDLRKREFYSRTATDPPGKRANTNDCRTSTGNEINS